MMLRTHTEKRLTWNPQMRLSELKKFIYLEDFLANQELNYKLLKNNVLLKPICGYSQEFQHLPSPKLIMSKDFAPNWSRRSLILARKKIFYSLLCDYPNYLIEQFSYSILYQTIPRHCMKRILHWPWSSVINRMNWKATIGW